MTCVDIPQLAEEQLAETSQSGDAIFRRPSFDTKCRQLMKKIEHVNTDDSRGENGRTAVGVHTHMAAENARKERRCRSPNVLAAIAPHVFEPQ